MKIDKIIYKDGAEIIEILCRRNGKKIKFSFPIKKMKPVPTKQNSIVSIEIDKEIGSEGISYILRNGIPGTIHLDAFREYSGDPDFFRDLAVYNSTLLLEKLNNENPISKKELATKLTTSVAQIYRIFESSYYGKTLDQIVKTLAIYGYKTELSLKEIAPTEQLTSSIVDLNKYRFIDEQKKQAFKPQPFRTLNFRSAEDGTAQAL